ncbi:MAG: glycosyltransferase family 4 protein [Clostridia bacterium]|nr:glycosyltransferase family 4 protein [Clostridia bacterium]
MKILFITIGGFGDSKSQGIYVDLMREFVNNNHDVYVACANQNAENTSVDNDTQMNILRVATGKLTKTNIIRKGISTLMVETQFKNAIKKYFKDVKFDLVMYSTPPITFADVIAYVKKRDGAKSYLLLKDIFPQNAVDIGMMAKRGLKSIIYKLFKKKEEKLYRISDYIGCMSEANVNYILKENAYINPEMVHINPNSIGVNECELNDSKKIEIYNKYGIPENARTFIYGGNLGKPQDIPFVIECLKANVDKDDRFFIICGTGTEYPKLKAFVDEFKPQNVLLLNGLEKAEYEEFVKAFDVGLIFLDHRFTIPNFPSRLLSYMQSKMPVLACTDPNTDIGKVITENDFGWWCESNSTEAFTKTIDEAVNADLKVLGENGFDFLKQNYTSEKSYNIIIERIK